MNIYLKQLLIDAIIIPIAYLVLRLIFKKSIIFNFGFYTVFFVIFVSFMTVVGQNLGGLNTLWITPLNVFGGYILFTYINRTLRKPLEHSIAQVRELSEGNLQIKVQQSDSENELGILNNALADLIHKLSTIINDIRINAENLASSSQQLSSSSEQLSQGASEQASSLEEVSSTMEEISANIQQNTNNAEQTQKVSQEASVGMIQVEEQSVKAIEANKTIAEKITIINDIAFQTNILALNAAVEAARAGEHGKGFAVVASEVRKLAEHSKLAAEQIVTLAKSSLNLSEGAGNIMRETLPKIEHTTLLIQEISSASVEQNNGASQVNNAIQQMNSITQQNAASSEELALNAEELAVQAQQLNEAISFFKTGEKTIEKGFKGKNSIAKTKPFVNKEKMIPKKKVTNVASSKGANIYLDDTRDNDFEHF